MCLVVKNKPLKAAEAALQLFPAKAEFNSELKALTLRESKTGLPFQHLSTLLSHLPR